MSAETSMPFEEELPSMADAQKVAENVQPGNELQQAAADAILRLAFAAEVRRAFPGADAPCAIGPSDCYAPQPRGINVPYRRNALRRTAPRHFDR